MERLFLWDIDGTLLTSGTVARQAFHAALGKFLGREFEQFEVPTAGKTDPEIARSMLTALNVGPEDIDRSIKMVLRAYGPELAARRKEIAASGRVFAGVREVLSIIDETRSLNTVLTGNIAVNAICKLDAFRLTSHFDLEVGGFGSDSAVRSELVDVVLNRAEIKRNKYFTEEDIWVIGDTPLDFAVAQEHQTRCLLVATGRYPLEELQHLPADLVVADLSDVDLILKTLLGD